MENFPVHLVPIRTKYLDLNLYKWKTADLNNGLISL